TRASPGGSKLRADRGVNFPDTQLDIPFPTKQDEAALDFAAKHADIVGLSFVQTPAEVAALDDALRRRGADRTTIMLKIETRRAFETLPKLLFAAIPTRPVAAMIARGDLAVECGYERLAEMQEEILWVAEAAHVPVVWATSVLDGLARTGVPSR